MGSYTIYNIYIINRWNLVWWKLMQRRDDNLLFYVLSKQTKVYIAFYKVHLKFASTGFAEIFEIDISVILIIFQVLGINDYIV